MPLPSGIQPESHLRTDLWPRRRMVSVPDTSGAISTLSSYVLLSPSLQSFPLGFGIAGQLALPSGVLAVSHWFGVSALVERASARAKSIATGRQRWSGRYVSPLPHLLASARRSNSRSASPDSDIGSRYRLDGRPEHPPLPSHTSPNVVRLLSLPSPRSSGSAREVSTNFRSACQGSGTDSRHRRRSCPCTTAAVDTTSPNVVRLLSLHCTPRPRSSGSARRSNSRSACRGSGTGSRCRRRSFPRTHHCHRTCRRG